MASSIDEKWIGLALAVSSSMAIGMSSIITKKGLNAAGRDSYASDDFAYLKNPIWWGGMFTLFLGEVANFAAYTFAPPILVTPLGALSVLIGAILASFLLNETLGHLGRLGCTLSLIGSLIIVLHAPEDKSIGTVEEILRYAMEPPFLVYLLITLSYVVFAVYYLSPRYGAKNPAVYISICALIGSISVMAIKAFGVALKLTFGGKNQFVYPSTYVFGLVSAACILVQMAYLNKAFDRFSVNVVNLIYYVFFTTSTITASVILFQGFNTTNATDIISLLSGFVIILLGVYIINLSRSKTRGNRNTADEEELLEEETLMLRDIGGDGDEDAPPKPRRDTHSRSQREREDEMWISRSSPNRL
ncbi:duf803 domain membrane protein [Moniliophthora roreri MCA 2997]|uniref:Duf803 domain membrane protein n=2 Tax=Moniliophthora roreri TaxID=221103 RepID=V2Y374_MONRO|nr:duf803 domain membrane protein [Moniliophthora roreri MCA 2997]